MLKVIKLVKKNSYRSDAEKSSDLLRVAFLLYSSLGSLEIRELRELR
jgi:hypothetical protein